MVIMEWYLAYANRNGEWHATGVSPDLEDPRMLSGKREVPKATDLLVSRTSRQVMTEHTTRSAYRVERRSIRHTSAARVPDQCKGIERMLEGRRLMSAGLTSAAGQ